MEESLKSARFAHTLVVSVAAAMLVFVISVDLPINPYIRAREESRSLLPALNMLFERYSVGVTNWYREHGTIAALERNGISIESVRTDQLPGKNAPIRDIYSLLEARRKNEFTKVYAFQAKDLSLKSGLGLERGGKYTVHFDQEPPMIMLVPFDPEGNWNGQCHAQFTRSDREPVKTIFPFTESTQISLGSEVDQMLKDQGVLEVTGGEVSALPALRAVWHAVGHLHWGEVDEQLKIKEKEFEENSASDVAVLGMTINANVAAVVGPVILSILLLYLLSHIDHLQRLPSSQAFMDFPWLASMQSKFAKSLWFTSVILLPTISSLWLIYASNLGNVSRILWLLVCGPVTIWLGYEVWKRAARLKDQQVASVNKHPTTGLDVGNA